MVSLSLAAALLLSSGFLGAEELTITSFGKNGLLTFSCPAPNLSYKVEWASSPEGPWSCSWEDLCQIEPGAASPVTRAVPMFYRVKSPAYVQTNELLTESEAGILIQANEGNEDFVLLDVRSAGEFDSGHIIGAVNIDINGPTFDEVLALLPRDKKYLVNCWSGNRSHNAVGTMQTLGFHTVYDLGGGFSAFSANPAHAGLID